MTMRRIILLGVLAALALLLGGFHQWNAQADPTGNETCGGHVTINSHAYNGNDTWLMDVGWACGTDKTFTMEIQHTMNGGQTVFDILEVGHRSPSGCNILCNDFFPSLGGLCPVNGSYRARVNWNNHSLTTSWVGAGIVCGGQQQFP